MLRRLDLQDPWRSLDKRFWPDNLPAGKRTIFYGHNGSGKSTLAELLLSLAEGTCATRVIWEDENQRTNNTDAVSPMPMAVFTRKWVESNLADFLDGASASAIVTLGKEAIDAKEEEARLIEEIDGLLVAAKSAADQQRAATDKVEKLVRKVQERIVSELKEFDYNYFTKNRFSVAKVQDDLRKYKGEYPDSNSHAEALKRLGEGAPSTVPEVVPPSNSVVRELTGLAELLAETPTRVAIKTLEGKTAAQSWVEQGRHLHEELDHCLFCAGEISGDRRDQLARHFDESWLQIRSNARQLVAAVTDDKQALLAWLAALPATTSLASELQLVYEEAVERAQVEVGDHVAALTAIEMVLNEKIADPSATPDPPEWSVLSTTPTTTVLAQAVTKNNDQARRHAEVTEERKQTVLDHLVGSQSEAFRDLEEQAKGLATKSRTANDAADLAQRRLNEVRQAQFTTKNMADTLTRDLARVYGKNHLSVTVTSDGKSYACRRGDEPGTDLSDGERTTLSLLYFLRKLEDEQAPGVDRSQRIVVIDDPSSSLDREALFATHQWLIDTLNSFGQYIILTHDFSLLRLFIKSQNNAWGSSMKRIKQGQADEMRFPKVSFLEMYAASVNGERRSRVGKLPRVLLNNTSEYAYLFSMVMAGIAEPQDDERLFLLPNAARRVLEIFASYKAPHRTNFREQLEVLVESQEGEPYRDVYDFCNRFSHGEGNESVDVLDARAVHRQISRCMEFLSKLDSEHYDRMLDATDSRRPSEYTPN